MARASKRIYEALRHLCDGRVFVAPRRESDDQTLLPYITHQVISDVPVNSLDGYTGHSRCQCRLTATPPPTAQQRSCASA